MHYTVIINSENKEGNFPRRTVRNIGAGNVIGLIKIIYGEFNMESDGDDLHIYAKHLTDHDKEYQWASLLDDDGVQH